MSKRRKSAVGILGHIQFRLILEGFGTCEVSFPTPVPRSQKIGRNWTVDIPRAHSGEAFEVALRAVRAVAADYDCSDFRVPAGFQ